MYSTTADQKPRSSTPSAATQVILSPKKLGQLRDVSSTKPTGKQDDLNIVIKEDKQVILNPAKSVYKTVCMCAGTLCLGLTYSLLGPALLDIVYILQTDLASFSIAFTFANLGYMLGAILCGVLYDPLNPELLFTGAMLILGGATICAPFITVLAPFVVMVCLQAVSMGFTDTACQAYIVALWKGTKYMEPLMQTTHLMWSVGSTVCPLIVQPFLMPQSSNNTTEVTYTSTVKTTTVKSTAIAEASTLYGITNNTAESHETTTNVQYAYIIVGCVSLITAFMFAMAFMINPQPLFRNKPKISKSHSKSKTTKSYGKFGYCLLAILFMFLFMYAWSEGVYGSYMATYVVEGLKWEKYTGSVITSILWGSMGIGRLLSIPLSLFLTPRQMVYGDTILITLAGGILLLSAYTTDVLTWVGASMAGLGLGSTYASIVLWAEIYIDVNGRVSAVFLVGGSVGAMVGTSLLAILFDAYSHMWMVYFNIGSGLLSILVFVAADIFAYRYKRQLEQPNGNNSMGENPNVFNTRL